MASSSFDPGEHPQRGYLGRLQGESGVGRQSMVTAALVGGGGSGEGIASGWEGRKRRAELDDNSTWIPGRDGL